MRVNRRESRFWLTFPVVLPGDFACASGTPDTMNSLATYRDVVEEVTTEVRSRVDAALAAGVWRWNIVVDPGVGFAKDGKQNLELLRGLGRFRVFGGGACGGDDPETFTSPFPALVGPSRKRFIGAVTGKTDAKVREG